MTASARFLFFIAIITFLGCNPSTDEPDNTPDPASSAAKETAPSQTNQDLPPVDLQEELDGDLSTPTLAMSTPALPVASSPWPDSETTPPSEPSTPATADPTTETTPPATPSQPETMPEFSPSPPVDSSERKATLWNGKPFAQPTDQSNIPLFEGDLSPVDPTTEPLTPTPPATLPETSPATSEEPKPEPPLNPLRNHSDTGAVHPVAGASLADPDEHLQANNLRTEEEIAPTSTPPTNTTTTAAGNQTPPTDRPNSKGQPFDPIKVNGLYFKNWPKPDLTLVMTGRQNGYVEPCGCAGMERMQGGLTRRATFLENLVEKKKWPVVAMDIGNQVKGRKRQTELKFQHTTEALLNMKYSAIGLGIADLQLPAGELAAITSNENSPFVAANIDLLQKDSELIEKVQLIERDGIKIGITAVLGDSFRKQLNSKDIITTDPVAAIQKVLPSFKKCEVRILLAYADEKESTALAKQFPMFNVVVTAAGGPEPPKEPFVIPGTKTYLVQVGEKGSCAVVLGIYRDRKTPVRYQRVTLDSRFPTSEKIHRLTGIYQDQLKMLGLEGLRIKPVPCPESETKGKYIGSKKCATCHEESYDVWRKSKHAKGWKTLVEADPPRNHDPECISCHVVGWDPQRYYPFVGGFLSSEKTPHLENIGCESCHGPGNAHAQAEEGSDAALQKRLQKAMVVTIEESRSNPQKMCYNCHDLDNSPEFNFDKYWPEVKHYEDVEDDDEDEDKD